MISFAIMTRAFIPVKIAIPVQGKPDDVKIETEFGNTGFRLKNIFINHNFFYLFYAMILLKDLRSPRI